MSHVRTVRGRRPLGRGATLEKRWLGFTGNVLALAAGTQGVMLASATDTTDTIMRTRGNLVAFLDGVAAPGQLVQVAVGLWIVPEGTGSTVLGSPIADDNADWFYHSVFALGYEEGVVNVIDYSGIPVFREVVDDKAMRIGRPDSEIQMVVENVSIGSASAVNVQMYGRFLLGR